MKTTKKSRFTSGLLLIALVMSLLPVTLVAAPPANGVEISVIAPASVQQGTQFYLYIDLLYDDAFSPGLDNLEVNVTYNAAQVSANARTAAEASGNAPGWVNLSVPISATPADTTSGTRTISFQRMATDLLGVGGSAGRFAIASFNARPDAYPGNITFTISVLPDLSQSGTFGADLAINRYTFPTTITIPVTAEPIPPTGLTLEENVPVGFAVGDTEDIEVALVPTNVDTVTGFTIAWTSNNTDIVTVAQASTAATVLTNSVTAVAVGTTTVTAQLMNGTTAVGTPVTFNITVSDSADAITGARSQLNGKITEAQGWAALNNIVAGIPAETLATRRAVTQEQLNTFNAAIETAQTAHALTPTTVTALNNARTTLETAMETLLNVSVPGELPAFSFGLGVRTTTGLAQGLVQHRISLTENEDGAVNGLYVLVQYVTEIGDDVFTVWNVFNAGAVAGGMDIFYTTTVSRVNVMLVTADGRAFYINDTPIPADSDAILDVDNWQQP